MFGLRYLVLAGLIILASGTCYHPDRNESDDEACGFNTDYCCPSGDTCVAQGLCRDVNNYSNGSLTYFQDNADPGPYNYTGLYTTATCTNADWPSSDCETHCLASDNSKSAYIWACNDELTVFCCHNGSIALAQGDCCDGATWSLPSSPLELNVSLRTTYQASSASASSPTVSSLSASTTGSTLSSAVSVITVFTVAATTTNATSSTLAASATSAISTTSSLTDKPGLSTAAEAGIGVGIGAFAIGAMTIGFLLWRRRSHRNLRPYNQAKTGAVSSGYLSETSETHVEVRYPQELPPSPRRFELPTRHHKHYELPS